MPGRKSELGQYFTKKNPFDSCVPFLAWIARIRYMGPVLEPFAGAGDIVRMLKDTFREWVAYDLEPKNEGILPRDTLELWPTLANGAPYPVVITNPPWLARKSAKAKGLRYPDTQHANIYLVALEKCLESDFVAIILPQSFLNLAHRYPRLETIVLLGSGTFEDTEEPSLLALFGPDVREDSDIWAHNQNLGQMRVLMGGSLDRNQPGANRIKFNHPEGQIGLFTVDGRKTQRPHFVCSNSIGDDYETGSRFVTKIYIESLPDEQVKDVIKHANYILEEFRRATIDLGLTAIRGRRGDGGQRYRLSFTTARAILLQALRRVSS